MKKKMWVASPLMYIAVLIMFVMTLLSFNKNMTLFIVELTITITFTISMIFSRAHFWLHCRYIMKSAKSVLLTENEEALNELEMPVLVAGLDGDIMWANNSFSSSIAKLEDVLGEDATKFVFPKTLRQISKEKGTNIEYKEKKFTAFAVKTKFSYILYFIDDTYYKKIQKEYTEKKPVVAVVSFDNREELLRNSGGAEESRITSEVETQIREWSHELNGFMRKLSNSLYLIITDEINTQKARNNKFEILDKVREIKGAKDLSATISVGVGRDASSATESEVWARKALEMALGRGGDQVVIISNNDKFEFFGGVSRGVEKSDKVRARVIATSLADNIKKAEKVFIMGHKFSDLDSVGSAIGVWAIAKHSLKKEVHIVINQAQSLASALINDMIKAYPNDRVFISSNEALAEFSSKTMVVVVDTHIENYTECPELIKKGKDIVVIDHHRMMVNHIKNSTIFFHEPAVSSASEMVTELAQYIDVNAISKVEACALLSGITLDTKNFILKTGVRTFEAAAILRQRGADTVKVKKYFANTMSTYKEKSRFVAAAEIFNSCAVAVGRGENDTSRISAAQAADELLYIQGVKASFVIFELGEEIIISGRSLGEVNVQVILEEFGGGGHLTMAGAQVKDMSIEEAKDALFTVLEDKLTNN